MVYDYMLDKVLDTIKEIVGIAKFHDTQILIDTDDKLPDYITLNVVILTTCLIKDDNKLCPQIFLEEAFYNE